MALRNKALPRSGQPDFKAGGSASNGFGELSPGGYSMTAALLIEVVLTAWPGVSRVVRALDRGASAALADVVTAD